MTDSSVIEEPCPDSVPRRSRWLILPAIAVFMGILLATHYYLADRLVWSPAWPSGVTRWLLALLGLFFVSLVLHPIIQRFGSLRWAEIVGWPASIWMGVLFLLVLLLGVSELGVWVADGLGLFGPLDPVDVSRVRAFLVLIVLVPVTAMAIRQGIALPEVKRLEIELERWPAGLDGLRVVQISDVHFSAMRGYGFARFLADRVNSLDPDLIAVTGDLVDGDVETLGPELEPLASMHARLGVYFVTGNHDHYSGPDAWLPRIGELGMQVLRNEHRVIDGGAGSFVMAGVDDHNAGRLPGGYGEDLGAALGGVPEDCPVLLLAHDPSTFKAAQRLSVDLQLSGHTHGGQIWPFGYIVRLVVPFVAGLYRRGKATLYVSRGTGFWGPPMRLGSPAEITEIRLRSAVH